MQNHISGSRNVLLLGGIIVDRYYEVERYPEVGQDTLIRNSYDRVGGCALNVAVTLKNLGTLPYIVNKFGDDEIGKKIEKYIDILGMPTNCMLKASGRNSGYCLNILDSTGERTFLTYKGCEGEFSLENIQSVLAENFAFAYITGYYLLNLQTTPQVLELVQQLRQSGCQIMFDPGPLVGQTDPTQLREMLRLSNWLIPNAHELVIIQNKLEISGEMASWLLKNGVSNIAVKKGVDGVDIITIASNFTVPGFPVNTKDTTGAGDSFAGGLIHGLVNDYPLREAASLANACGAFTTLIEGPHGSFSLDDIRNFIATIKDNNL